MQSNKPSSKKTRNIAETGNAVVPELKSTSAEAMSKPREQRSSTVKKNEAIETSSAKRHRKTAPPVAVESAAAPKAMAASAGAGAEVSAPSAVVQSHAAKPPVTRERVAELAHSYWAARGYAQGNPEEDWFRAESELLAQS
ncbi:MAG TPA: DUF2934 domain-containing protein [Bryobacteraceae bacterium]|jgi:hypothetical protein|nr:DUF2934 domain-containing protein [Bryobacteraceae bacterium]